jgi:hypothetical protein
MQIEIQLLLILPYTAATLCSSKEQGEPQHRAPRIFIRPWPLLAWLLPPLERSVQAHPYRGGVVRTIAVAGRAGYVLRCPPTTWNVMDR